MKMILMFQSSDFNHWSIIVQFGIVSIMLIVGNIIRRKSRFFKNLLFPTAIIAGFIGLGVKYLIWGLNIEIDGQSILTNGFLEAITYHTIALGFIAMGLKTVKKANENKIKGRPFKTGLIIVNTYLLQGIIALVLTFVISFAFKSIPNYSGILLPLGFGQGPGQAGNIGGVFESQGFVGGRSFGLAIATLGILWSCVAGIFYINKRSKTGEVSRAGEEKVIPLSSEMIEDSDEIPVSEAIDRLSIQIILIVLIYFLSYLFMKGLTSIINVDAVVNLIWGFNFIFGMLFAMLVKIILKGLRKKKWMNRRYTNNYLLNRITGLVFDFMIVASIMSIDLKALANIELWITLLIISITAGFITYFYLKKVIYRTYPNYRHEAFATLFGNLTGTASNGIALLREIDPDFKTPAADDLVTGSSTAVLFGAPLLAVISVIYLPEWYWLFGSFSILVIFFIIFTIFLRKEKKPAITNED